MSTNHSDNAYQDCISLTHKIAEQYDEGQTFTVQAWAAVAAYDTADQ